MNIDRDTYEAWLLDRLEGRLTAEQERALDAFLAANSDLAPGSGALPSIDAGEAVFGDLASLKRTYPPQGLPDAARINDFLIARGEGDLTAEQFKALERFLFEHPDHERTARLVAAARVPAVPVPWLAKAKLEKHFPPVGMPDRERITDFLIAAAEGDLSNAQLKALTNLVASDAGLQREEVLVNAARIPKEAIAFSAKASLKKTSGRVVPLWSFGSPLVRYAAAASVVLVLGLALWTLGTGAPDRPATAQEQQPATVPVEPGNAPVVQPTPERTPTDPETSTPSGVPQGQRMDRPSQAHPVPRAGQPRLVPERMEPALALRPVPVHERPVNVDVPDVPVSTEAPEQLLAAVSPPAAGSQPRTVSELLVAGVRGRVLNEPATDDRPLDQRDAVALADKGLKGITGGAGSVQVQRTAKRDRFKVRLGDGLAFSGSIGR